MGLEQEGAEPENSGSSGDAGPQNLRVALSGGGLRAAVFDLGLLLYLVDAGLNARVRQISSVSGGSITSAFVARRCDFQKVSPGEFDRIAADLLNIIVRHGLMRRPLIVGYLALVIAAAGFTVSAWLTQFPVHLSGWICLLLAVGIGLLLTLRGRVMDLQLERTLAPDSARTSGRLLGDVISTVEHIFCATDLRTGMFFYFSTANSGYAYSPVLGSSRCVQQPLARVVRASAAFPGGIPPVRYKSRRHFSLTFTEAAAQLRITGNYSLGHYAPRIFMLADGGIWNNLATEPFLADHPWRGPVISNMGSVHSQPAELLIVADASAPVLASSIRDFYVPLLGEVFSLKRSLKIATENTVLPRIEAIRARPTALKFPGFCDLVSSFLRLVTVWLHVGRGGVTGSDGP